MQKPDGLTFLTPMNYELLTNNLLVSEICGIGESRAKYLQSRGAFNLKQARSLPGLPNDLKSLIFLTNNEPLTNDYEAPKSVSRTYTTYQATGDKRQVASLVRNLIEEACGKLREMQMGGRTFGLRLDAFKTRHTISYPTSDPEIIYSYFIRQELPENVRFAGIWISNLMLNVQCSMFNKRDKLLLATDKINKKFGLFTIYPANLLGRELIRPEVTGFLGDKYYQLRNSNDIGNSNL
jgi:nucleotidyltransferase/DNA polymerase involved in DNA repair